MSWTPLTEPRAAQTSNAAGGKRVKEGKRVDVFVAVIKELGDTTVLFPRDIARSYYEIVFVGRRDSCREFMEPRDPVKKMVQFGLLVEKRKGAQRG